MNCPKCNNQIEIKLASKIIAKNAKVLTGMTTILTLKCEKCSNIFQLPVSSKSFISINKDNPKN